VPATEVYPSSARRDLQGGVAVAAFGCVIAVLSWQMDRMTQQGATLHTAPGLWPGIVGTVLAVLGGVLVLRSRFALAVALFFVYALLLVGRGLPYWLGTALFVSTFVFLFQYTQRKAAGSTLRGVAVALACGVLTTGAVTLVFERLFYVRLP